MSDLFCVSDHLLMLDTPPRLSNKIAGQSSTKGSSSPTLDHDSSLGDSVSQAVGVVTGGLLPILFGEGGKQIN